MTPDQIIDEAESICTDFGVPWPTTNSVKYSRINQASMRLFSDAAKVDREYYGLSFRLSLDQNGCADLSKVGTLTRNPQTGRLEGAFAIERIDDIRIAEAKDPALVTKRVNVVPLHDAEAHEAVGRRATLRSHVLEAFGDDLAGVTKVVVYYTRKPRAIGRDGLVDGATEQIPVELDPPWDWTLVWDLVAYLITLTDQMDREEKERLHAIALARYDSIHKDYLAHVAGFVRMRQDRHS